MKINFCLSHLIPCRYYVGGDNSRFKCVAGDTECGKSKKFMEEAIENVPTFSEEVIPQKITLNKCPENRNFYCQKAIKRDANKFGCEGTAKFCSNWVNYYEIIERFMTSRGKIKTSILVELSKEFSPEKEPFIRPPMEPSKNL